MDRRFGESDPTMTPEEKALQRFVKEKEKGNRRGAIFNLEDAGDDDQLTHFGKSLSFDRPSRLDDFEEFDTTVSDEDLQLSGEDERPSKRRRLSETPSDGDAISDSSEKKRTEQPRTKKEVMAEIVAKSKLHKYERQQAKEDDDDLRAELDKGLPDIFALLQGVPRVPTPASKPVDASAAINPDRAALLNGKDRSQADKEYDERLRQMAFDQRAKPTERTIKEEERLQLEVQRLNELENKRLRRMRGDPNDSDEEEVMGKENLLGNEDTNEQINDNFGLGSGIMDQNEISKLGFEDEDDFIIENNLIASDIDEPFSENESDNDQNDKPKEENEDDEFVQGLLTINDSGRDGLNLSDAQSERLHPSNTENLAYTYSCPESHQDWLQMTKDIPIHNLATVIQRIRALYHPKLHSDNKSKLGIFSTVLVDHISFLTNKLDHPPFVVLETLIRHIHSLAKTFPEEVARTFRKHLKSFHETRPIAMSPGDLILLTAIGSIFPTSDHFHQVVTPAVLCMTRYISQTVPQSLNDLVKGTYIESLCLQYQQVSKRYIPELVDYSLQTMLTLAPVKLNRKSKPYPYHPPCSSLKIQHNLKVSDDFARKLKFWDIIPSVNPSEISIEELKTTLLTTHLTLINTMADLWADKPAFCEVFSPFLEILQHLLGNPCSSTLPSTTKVSPSPAPHSPTLSHS